MVLEVLGPWEGVGLAFSGPTLLCLAIVSFLGGNNSGTASMATAVSAAHAIAGVRGGKGLCCYAVTMAYKFSHPHPQCIIVVFPKRSENSPTHLSR